MKLKKICKNEIKKIVIYPLSILFFASIGFTIGGGIASRQAKSIGSDNNPEKSQKYMNKREAEVKPQRSSDLKEFDPYKSDGRKVVYLTFDDGPSPNNTPKILKILKQYNVKATFFLIGKNVEQNKGLVKEEVAEGNSVGNHTYSHEMSYIYSDPRIFMSDVEKCEEILKSILGDNYDSKLIRFPGGSFGEKLKPFRDEAKKDGYRYIDWNDLTGDAEYNNVPVQNLLSNVKKYAIYSHIVILMHDAPTKVTTVQALPQIIEYFKSRGYLFATLK